MSLTNSNLSEELYLVPRGTLENQKNANRSPYTEFVLTITYDVVSGDLLKNTEIENNLK